MNRNDYIKFSRLVGILTIIYFAYLGVRSILYLTEIGPWAFSDSAAYITVAKNILAGRGIVLQNPAGHYNLFPSHTPLYPILTAGLMKAGMDPIQASRWLNAILFGLVILLGGLSTLGFTRSPAYGVGVSYLFSRSIEAQRAFSGMMSEGIFLFFFIAALIPLTMSLIKQRQKNWLILAGILAGFSVLARYAGISVVAAGFLAILLLTRGKLAARIKDSLRFAIPAVLISALWLVPVFLSTRTFGDRPVGSLSNPFGKATVYFSEFIKIWSGWLPYFQRGNHILSPAAKLLILFVILAAIVGLIIARKRKSKSAFWALTIVLASLCYLAVHLFSFVTANTQPDINGRLLLPLLLLFYLFLPAILSSITSWIRIPLLGKILFIAFVFISANYFAGRLNDFRVEMHGYGNGYTSVRWKDDRVFDALDNISANTSIASNEAAMVLFYTERFPVPIKYDPDTDRFDRPSGKTSYVLFRSPTDPAEASALDNLIMNLLVTHSSAIEEKDSILLIPRQ